MIVMMQTAEDLNLKNGMDDGLWALRPRADSPQPGV